MVPAGVPAHSLLPILPPPPGTAMWWLVTPTPMAFENIGFTRPVESLFSGYIYIFLQIYSDQN